MGFDASAFELRDASLLPPKRPKKVRRDMMAVEHTAVGGGRDRAKPATSSQLA